MANASQATLLTAQQIDRLLSRNRKAAKPAIIEKLRHGFKGFARLMVDFDDIGLCLWEQMLEAEAEADEDGLRGFESATALRAAVALSEVVQGAKVRERRPGGAAASEPQAKRART